MASFEQFIRERRYLSNVSPQQSSGTSTPTFFLGFEPRHRVAAQTRRAQGYTHGLPSEWILTLEPSVSRTRLANTRDDPKRELLNHGRLG